MAIIAVSGFLLDFTHLRKILNVHLFETELISTEHNNFDQELNLYADKYLGKGTQRHKLMINQSTFKNIYIMYKLISNF